MKKVVERVRQLIMGINQDVGSYQQLEQLLKAQHGNMIRRDNQAIHHNNERQLQLLQVLRGSTQLRIQLMRSFGLQANNEDLQRLASRLPTAASDKLLVQWHKLESSVIRCKKLNDHNGRLLANQQLLIRRLLNVQEDFYQPSL